MFGDNCQSNGWISNLQLLLLLLLLLLRYAVL